MAYFLLKKCQLDRIAVMNELDKVSFLTAAVCHDYGHDGLTNVYHVNRGSQRALVYND